MRQQHPRGDLLLSGFQDWLLVAAFEDRQLAQFRQVFLDIFNAVQVHFALLDELHYSDLYNLNSGLDRAVRGSLTAVTNLVCENISVSNSQRMLCFR